MEKDLPLKLERETLLQLAPEQLVDIIGEQAIAISYLWVEVRGYFSTAATFPQAEFARK
ncbi:hypothetical protein [Nostoc favosum]|uniref:Uncharacterized protein n=1 Tax=Nostoc favosum CHAB5714 TaxID=2780399 RepID=A0ABS8IHM2_9NOSO|nr:hypothetical protein [Nostoc favosum]MCC5603300.1 hypothetical protein [Nostoc favosum CHAB5714]